MSGQNISNIANITHLDDDLHPDVKNFLTLFDKVENNDNMDELNGLTESERAIWPEAKEKALAHYQPYDGKYWWEDHPDVKTFYELRKKIHPDDPSQEATESERALWPEVRARAYMVRDKAEGAWRGTTSITGKTKEERLEFIQGSLLITPDYVKWRIKDLLNNHLQSVISSYLKNEERQDVNLKEEEEKFMNSDKIKKFLANAEKKKKRCDELMQYDNDFDLYKAMTAKEISDFI